MRRILTGFVAVSVALSTALPTVLAASSTSASTVSSTSTSQNQWFKMTIDMNGQTLSTPYGIAKSDGSNLTTYIPMYYVDQALIKVGYKVTWDGVNKIWKLTTPQQSLQFTSMQIGAGNTSIQANGILIKKVNTIVLPDPAGGVNTTYMPIYYVTPLFQALGITAAWDGIHHVWAITSDTSSSSSSSGTSSSTSGGSGGSNSSTSSSSSGSSNGSSGSSATLSTPTVELQQTNGISNISVSGALGQAMLTLYTTDGTSVISTAADTNGTATFYNVVPGSYYVEQTSNGASSGESNVITVSKTSTPAPTPTVFASQSNGVWYIGVNNAAPNAPLTLFNTNGNQISTVTANQYGYATFNNLNAGSYYVVESLNGQNVQSNAVSLNEGTTTSTTSTALATPSVSVNQSNGVTTIAVNNAQPNATVKLFNSNGTVLQTAAANNSGVASFSGVANGSYYVVQTFNGQQSAASNYVTVAITTSTPLPTPYPSVSENNGVASITVTNVQPNATVTLYDSNATAYQSMTAGNSGTVTFSNIPVGSYYADQSLNGQQSAASNYVYVTTTTSTSLATPSVSETQSSGLNTITVSNAQPNAIVILYESNATAYQTATVGSSGIVTFTNIPAGSYYAVQSLNGQQSTASNYVYVTAATSGALGAPVLTLSQNSGVTTISVNDVEPNATVTLYTTEGTASQTTTANSTGFASFSNLASGTYYAVQSVNGETSAASNHVTA